MDEYSTNFCKLKRCQKIYNRVSLTYVITCVLYIFAATYLMLLSVSGDSLFLFFDGLVFKGAILYCGYMGAYKRDNRYAAAAPIIASLNTGIGAIFTNNGNYLEMFLGGGIHVDLIVTDLTIILMALTIYANKMYKWLEEQPGFPHFNERYDEQKKQSETGYVSRFDMRNDLLAKSGSNDSPADGSASAKKGEMDSI